MILAQLYEINDIEHEIVKLHEKLEELYQMRWQMFSTRNSLSELPESEEQFSHLDALDGLVDLKDIDLSFK